MNRFMKPKYPQKKQINLAMWGKSKGEIIRLSVLAAVTVVACGLFTYFFVFQKISVANEAKQNYLKMEKQIEKLEEKNGDYGELVKEYRKYDDEFFGEVEKMEKNRLKIMDMIERNVKGKADIERVSILQNEVTLEVSQTTLSQVSEIVSAFEAEESVSYVTLTMADAKNSDTGSLRADIRVQLTNEAAQEETNE